MSAVFFLVEKGLRIKLSVTKVPKSIPDRPGIKCSRHGMTETVIVTDRTLLLDLKITKAGARASAFCFSSAPAKVIEEKVVAPPPKPVQASNAFTFCPFNGSRADFLHERALWSEAHGSDHLQSLIRYGMTCDEVYAKERAAIEFPGFSVVPDSFVEDDPMVFGPSTVMVIDSYMKKDRKRLFGFRHMGSKIGIGYDENSTIVVVIRGYLGLCDLVRPFSEVLSVVEPN